MIDFNFVPEEERENDITHLIEIEPDIYLFSQDSETVKYQSEVVEPLDFGD